MALRPVDAVSLIRISKEDRACYLRKLFLVLDRRRSEGLPGRVLRGRTCFLRARVKGGIRSFVVHGVMEYCVEGYEKVIVKTRRGSFTSVRVIVSPSSHA